MLNKLQNIHPIFFVLLATIFEVSGDAIVRMGIYKHEGLMRIGFFMIGALFLFLYGFLLNLAPVEFGKIVGLYIATLFVVWQVITYLAFRTVPSLPILLGGALIVSGGMVITFWKN